MLEPFQIIKSEWKNVNLGIQKAKHDYHSFVFSNEHMSLSNFTGTTHNSVISSGSSIITLSQDPGITLFEGLKIEL